MDYQFKINILHRKVYQLKKKVYQLGILILYKTTVHFGLILRKLLKLV